ANCREALDILLKIDDLKGIGDLRGMADTWDSLGGLYFGIGETAQGEHCYQEAIALYRRLGHRHKEADVRTNLRDSQDRVGNRGAARQAWQQALRIFDDLNIDTTQIQAKLHRTPRASTVATTG